MAEEIDDKTKTADLAGVYLRAHQVATSEQISDLLRRYKQVSRKAEKEIRLAGSKVDLLLNLRRCVSKRLVPVEAVHTLVRNAEENGAQHIFYYRPSSEAAGEHLRKVAGNLGSGHKFLEKPLYGFPKKGLKWVDFRDGINGKPGDWLLKAYAFDRRRITVPDIPLDDDHPQDLDGLDGFRYEPIDVVLIIRWNEPGLLELRISNAGLSSNSKKDKRLTLLLTEFQELTGISAKQLSDWDLTSATTQMMKAEKADGDFSIGDSMIVTEGGRRFRASGVEDDESINEDPDAAAAIRQLLKKQSTAESTTVRWELPRHLSGYTKPVAVSVKVGGSSCNEIAIGSKVDPGVVDYVTAKLREADRDKIRSLDQSEWARSVFDGNSDPGDAVLKIAFDEGGENPAYDAIAGWMNRNKSRRLVSLSELARAKKSVPPGELLKAIYRLQKAGVFQRKIGVFDPHGVVIEELDPETKKLPPKVSSKDRGVEYDTENLRIADVYRYG